MINEKDMAPVANLNYPLTTYGLTLGINYKGFGKNALFYAIFRKIFEIFLISRHEGETVAIAMFCDII